MIEKMKKITVVATQDNKGAMLDGIRDMGVLHVSVKAAPDSALTERFASLGRIKAVLVDEKTALEKAAKKSKDSSSKKGSKASKADAVLLTGSEFDARHAEIESAVDEKRILSDEVLRMSVLRDGLTKWGDFNPSELRELADAGLPFSFYLLGKKELAALPEDVRYIMLKSVDKQNTIAVLGELGPEYASVRFNVPEKGIGQLTEGIEERKARIAEIDSLLASSVELIPSYDRAMAVLTDEIVYSSVSGGAESEEGLTLISGFIPEADLAMFRETAAKNCWAYALDDPVEEDPVPTKIRYNKVTKMMKPLFDMLGTVPGYREYDISMWFLLFLSLFVGMILGDAAYGALILIASIVLHIVSKKCSNLNLLLYVMSVATIAWGAVTGTWFGAEGAMRIPFLKALVIPQIANYPELFGIDATEAQNSVMKFCFLVGTIQLSLACLMNVVRNWKQKSLAFIADFAWLAMIISIYFLALMLVIGAEVNITLVFKVLIGGLVLVILFGGQAPGLSFGKGIKAGLGNAFTTFLNTISAFGNVMSYIRLFAVGMASLAIAQSFNGMASSMLKGWALPAGILILVIGHGLNIVMGALSVIVHGVRLNLLEFSGQLGMEWAGIPYEPFRKNVEVSKDTK